VVVGTVEELHRFILVFADRDDFEAGRWLTV
jgi:hypothetical protein